MTKEPIRIDDRLKRPRTIKLIKQSLAFLGVFLVGCGVMCFPFYNPFNVKRRTSIFENLTDTGILFKTGVGLVGIGILLLVISFLVPTPAETLKPEKN